MSSTNNSNNPTPSNPALSNPEPPNSTLSNPVTSNSRSSNRRPQYSNRIYNDPLYPISREAVENYKKNNNWSVINPGHADDYL
ncbi:hypothetical protein F8M41_019140 [Gigaspora margarita]|uniref:Uncharacterized protein n=1 Tax=Gigaspora margarita TaxID=4874 RepID=A0A8H4EKR3_GIGMA|nr:hypothetical protein F8M41_019140 [Gigaspora margarita]